MQKNTAENSQTVEFRAKHHLPDRADPETAKKAFAQIRENLGDDTDPMAVIWNDKLNVTQKRGVWIVAGICDEGGAYHFKWAYLTSSQKERLKKTISTFAGLSTRIKGALS